MSGRGRLIFGLATIPAAPLFVGVLFNPESPHWLITKGRSGQLLALGFMVSGPHLSGAAAIVAIVALFFYTGSFAVGFGPVFWLLISDIYPVRIRAPAMSVATIARLVSQFRGERGRR